MDSMSNDIKHHPQIDSMKMTEHKDHTMKFFILLPLVILSITNAVPPPSHLK